MKIERHETGPRMSKAVIHESGRHLSPQVPGRREAARRHGSFGPTWS